MGSTGTEEAIKLKLANKKKVIMDSDELMCKDPLESGIDDDSSSKSEKEESDENSTISHNNEDNHTKSYTNKTVTPSVNIHGARPRNDSETSSNSGNSSSSDRMKRQRTISGSNPMQSFLFPGVAASPPKFMSLEEVMKAANGVSNMVLAHEIAVDKNFKLEKFEPPEDSLEKTVRDTMHKAFWDNLAKQLGQTPVSYEQAFVLLQEVRDNLIDITLPHHTRLRQEISDKFDVELIKQQAKHDVLNFTDYSQFVLSIMARLCAPVRDDVIQDLMKEKDVVTVFRGVMETLDHMRLDMANYTIQQIRPHLIAQSVNYERKKFTEFLETQNDGLEITREWLTKHILSEDLEITDDLAIRNVNSRVISKAYLQLLSWSDADPLPETVVMDGSRVLELRDRLTQVCIMGATILVTMSSVAPLLVQADAFKIKLKKNICSILDPALTIQETYDLVGNIAEQVVKDVSDHLLEHEKPPLLASVIAALKSQLIEIKNPQQKIRQLISVRAHEFIGSLINSSTVRKIQLPPGLSTLQEELGHICGTLLRLVSHNRAVFGEYYADIITTHIKGARTIRDIEAALVNQPQATGGDQ